MVIREIIEKYLRDNGFDGLYFPGECACIVDDLMPCDSANEEGMDKKCKWLRIFDGHFNISCVNQTGERANGQFKPCTKYTDTKWNFKYCPYCGKEIEVEKS